MLTIYTIALNTTENGAPTRKILFAPGPEEAYDMLCEQMQAGDRARIYQTDLRIPTTAEEAVDWLNQNPRTILQMLVSVATRTYGGVNIIPQEIKGFMFSPAVDIQA